MIVKKKSNILRYHLFNCRGAGMLDYEALNQKSIRISKLMDLIDSKMQRWMELGQYV